MIKLIEVLLQEYTEFDDKRVPLDQPKVYTGPIKVGMLVIGQDNSRFRIIDINGNVISLKPTSEPGDVVRFPDDFREVAGFNTFWDYFTLEKIV